MLCVWYGSCFGAILIFCRCQCFSQSRPASLTHILQQFFSSLSLSEHFYAVQHKILSLSDGRKKSKIELSWVFFLFSFIATRLWTTTRSSAITHFYIYSSIQVGRSGERERAIESRRAPKKKSSSSYKQNYYTIYGVRPTTHQKKAEKKIVRTKHTFFLPSKKLRSLIRLSFCWEKHAAAETSWIKKIFGGKKERSLEETRHFRWPNIPCADFPREKCVPVKTIRKAIFLLVIKKKSGNFWCVKQKKIESKESAWSAFFSCQKFPNRHFFCSSL